MCPSEPQNSAGKFMGRSFGGGGEQIPHAQHMNQCGHWEGAKGRLPTFKSSQVRLILIPISALFGAGDY